MWGITHTIIPNKNTWQGMAGKAEGSRQQVGKKVICWECCKAQNVTITARAWGIAWGNMVSKVML